MWYRIKIKCYAIGDIQVLGLGELYPTSVRLLMEESLVKEPVGIVHNVEVKEAIFTYSTDFIILDCEVDT